MMNPKIILEFIESEDYSFVYSLLFHPSPVLYKGTTEVASGDGSPYGTKGMISPLYEVEFNHLNLPPRYLNVYTSELSERFFEILDGIRSEVKHCEIKVHAL